jgi:chromosome segregation ATPase
MLTLRYLLACPEPDVFELFVSGFFLVGQQTRAKKTESDIAMAARIRDTETRLTEADAKVRETEAALYELETAHATLAQKSEAHATEAIVSGNYAEKYARLKRMIIRVKSENSTLTAKVESQSVVIQEFEQENRVLTERLNSLSRLSEEREEYAKAMKLRVHEGGHTDFALREAEQKLEQTGQKLVGSSQRIARLEAELHDQTDIRAGLEVEIDRLREEMEKELETANKLRRDLEMVETQNELFRRVQKDINHIKRKYAGKKRMLTARLLEVEKEKRRWETIAKFTKRVCETKADTVKEVYSVDYH